MRPRPLLPLFLCLLLSMLAAYGQDPNAPYKTYPSTPVITAGPFLLDMGQRTVEVEWMTGADATGSVSYGVGRLDRSADPQVDGLRPVGTLHRVVLTGLQPGTAYQYQAVSRRVLRVRPYWPDMGQALHSPVYHFTTFDAGKPAASFNFVTDTHEDVGRISALMKMIRQTPADFLVDGGDPLNYAVSEQQLWDKFLEPFSEGLHQTTPLLYARGNHDYRGPFARQLGRYLHAPSGRYYFTRDDGPIHLIVVDTGEDKPDATNVYAGLNDLAAYKNTEFAWFQHDFATNPRMKSAPFRILVMHQPLFGPEAAARVQSEGQRRAARGENAKTRRWIALANQYHVDLIVAGHYHRFVHINPGRYGNHFPILVVGQDQVAHVAATSQAITVTDTTREGKVLDSFTVPHRP